MKHLAPIMLAVLLLSSVGVGYAQGQQPITATVDRTALSTDEMVTLTVTLTAVGLDAPRPVLPSLNGFNVVGTSTSSQLSIINGNVSSQVAYVYRLQPYQTGDLVIGPVQLSLNGQTIGTEPITVHVSQGTGAAQSSAPPAAPLAAPATPLQAPPSSTQSRQPAPAAPELDGQDLYVEAVVDNPTPYAGQQVVYTFRFYQAVNLWGQPHYQSPGFQGFWNERQSDQQEYRVESAGRIYQVTEIQTFLFPSVVGPVTIEPAVLITQGSLLRAGKTLQTEPIHMDVQPLPIGAPEGFDGAVGKYSLNGSVDTPQGKVNEPLTWQVSLTGWGNVNAAPDPRWPDLPGWRSFESEATVRTEVEDGRVGGVRSFERLLVPSVAGDTAFPALAYVYFDPDLGEYQKVSTEPIPVAIAPGAADEPAATLAPAPKETIEQRATDIRHLKPVPAELGVLAQPVTQSGLYWVTWALPLFGAAGFFIWQRRQRYWEDNLGLVRSSKARRKAKKALAQARKGKQDTYYVAAQILTTYLTEKLDRPVAGLTHQALGDLLAQRGVKSDLNERAEVLLVSSELGRFAPDADSADHAMSLLKETGMLIDALEKSL
jgi:hypothetical protein